LARADDRNPPGRAVSNRLLANVSAIWRSYHKRYGLPVANPTERLIPGALEARENPIDNHELKTWHERVMAMKNHVRRDLQRVALFTGVRTDGVRRLRWEDVDLDEDLIQIRNAKGDRPYTIPMVGTVREILEARRAANEHLFTAYGGDDGWCFPSLSRDFKRVQHVAEVKERAYVLDKHK
jgi:integrase